MRSKVRFLAKLLHYRRHATQIVVHNQSVKRAPPWLAANLFRRARKFGPTRAHGLQLVTAHNRPYRTTLERSLDYGGVSDYVVLRRHHSLPWRNAIKLLLLRDYLNSLQQMPPYLMFIDADDAVLRDSPLKAISLLQHYDCEVLFSATYFSREHFRNEATLALCAQFAQDAGSPGLFLNSGVYVGRTGTIVELVNRACESITDNDASDQPILRHLQPEFHPRVYVDYDLKLACRSDVRKRVDAK